MARKYEEYRNIPFCTEVCHADFYTYANVKDLADECQTSKDEIFRCRTLGILQSQHGKFWLADVDATGVQLEFKVRVSMIYLKSPPQSTVLSYPIQVFGTVQWKNRPVIFPRILQVLSFPMVIRIKDIMNNIAAIHLAKGNEDYEETLGDEPT